jgi:hypothetical protein
MTFPADFPTDYTSCYELQGGDADFLFTVAKAGANILTSGEQANELFDAGIHIPDGGIWFSGEGVPIKHQWRVCSTHNFYGD